MFRTIAFLLTIHTAQYSYSVHIKKETGHHNEHSVTVLDMLFSKFRQFFMLSDYVVYDLIIYIFWQAWSIIFLSVKLRCLWSYYIFFLQAWSILFLSVLSFVLLVWALAIWVIPIGTMRGRCLWTSLPLVLYAEALICITFVYGFQLEDELPSEINNINLEEIGFLRVKYQCLLLAGEVSIVLSCCIPLCPSAAVWKLFRLHPWQSPIFCEQKLATPN